MKIKSLLILLIILVSLVPVYLLNKYLQRKLKPKESFGRLFLYLFTIFLVVFTYTFLVVLVIKKLFGQA